MIYQNIQCFHLVGKVDGRYENLNFKVIVIIVYLNDKRDMIRAYIYMRLADESRLRKGNLVDEED